MAKQERAVKQQYHNAAGTVVPSVTTILGKYMDPSGLTRWAREQGYNQGRAGLPLDHYTKPEAEIGTLAHDMVEAFLHNRDFVPPPGVAEELLAGAKIAFGGFIDWTEQMRFSIRYTEVALVSEQYQFGGRIDAIGEIPGRLIVFDWKTSKHIYRDYGIQVAGYRVLWNENYPELPIESAIIVRFGKERGELETLYFKDLTPETNAFLARRKLYSDDKKCLGK